MREREGGEAEREEGRREKNNKVRGERQTDRQTEKDRQI